MIAADVPTEDVVAVVLDAAVNAIGMSSFGWAGVGDCSEEVGRAIQQARGHDIALVRALASAGPA